MILLLIDLYRQLRNKVGSLQIKNMKKLWEIIAEEANATFGSNFIFSPVENRWRLLERNDKKMGDNSIKTRKEAAGNFRRKNKLKKFLERKGTST
nr:unnamed protein product [Callosobruchus analis]